MGHCVVALAVDIASCYFHHGYCISKRETQRIYGDYPHRFSSHPFQEIKRLQQVRLEQKEVASLLDQRSMSQDELVAADGEAEDA